MRTQNWQLSKWRKETTVEKLHDIATIELYNFTTYSKKQLWPTRDGKH